MQSILFLVFILVVSVFAAELFTAKEARMRMLESRADREDLDAAVRYVTEAVRNAPVHVRPCLRVDIERVPEYEMASMWKRFSERDDWKVLITIELNRLGYRVGHIIDTCYDGYCPGNEPPRSINICWDTDP